jgi:acetyl esterase/lipase
MAIAVSNKLANQRVHSPRLQALIYPPTQYFNFSLPSAIAYSKLDTILRRGKAASWHMGVTKVTGNHEDLLVKNYHTTLILDQEMKEKYKACVNVDLIPDEYKLNKVYYANYDQIERFVFPSVSLHNYYTKMLESGELSGKLRNLFNADISPCLAAESELKRQPRTFMIVCEYDSRKDEGLIFAERLRLAGVSVDLSFHESGFHGEILANTPVAYQMRADLINFIQTNI